MAVTVYEKLDDLRRDHPSLADLIEKDMDVRNAKIAAGICPRCNEPLENGKCRKCGYCAGCGA